MTLVETRESRRSLFEKGNVEVLKRGRVTAARQQGRPRRRDSKGTREAEKENGTKMRVNYSEKVYREEIT